MLKNISLIISVIVFLASITKLWLIDDFEELTLNTKDKLYKIVLSFIKGIFVYFIYVFLLGGYYHLFHFLVNENAIYYFCVLIFIAILLGFIIVFLWIFGNTKVNIVEKYKTGLIFVNFLSRLAFVFLYISIWINQALKIGLSNYPYFYSSQNIFNVLKLSIVLAIIFYISSKILSKFYDLLITKKYYYFENYPEYFILKIVENKNILLKSFENNNYIYKSFEEIYNLNISVKIEEKSNKLNFIQIFIVLILGLFVLFLEMTPYLIKMLLLICKLLISISNSLLNRLEKTNIKNLRKKHAIITFIIRNIDKSAKALNIFVASMIKKSKKQISNIKIKISLLSS